MLTDRLKLHARNYADKVTRGDERFAQGQAERQQRRTFFSSYTRDRISKMSHEEFTAYMSRLWAMLVWGNKQYYVDKVIDANGFDPIKSALADLVWGTDPTPKRWDKFRSTTKQIGPAMMSEILAHVHPNECMVWNRRAFVALDYLGVPNLPRYNHQLTGKRYAALCDTALEIGRTLKDAGIPDPDLLTVDYFIWDELQVVDNLSKLHQPVDSTDERDDVPARGAPVETADFVHNEIRDKLAEIGAWLGFKTSIETKVAEGSVVDALWEASIGNMGRVMYVFEVQTRGSIDSLTVNLLKARNNPAVQGVVAVSDEAQLERIERQAKHVSDLSKWLRCWDYQEVLKVHANLEMVYEYINKLKLVPDAF